MEWENGLFLIAMALAYACIFVCRCYRKTKSRETVVLLALIVSAAPFLLENRSALVIFYAVFSLSLLVHFELSYEKRLRMLGQIVNELAEYQPQCRLLPAIADRISEKIQKSDFYFYSSKVGRLALQALATKGDSPLVEQHLNGALIQALRFVHDDIAEKWGNPSLGHAVTLLVERLNRNALLYLKTATVGNMADINDAAKENLKCLFALYYQDFYLKKPEEAQWEGPEAFAALHRKFDALAKFPLRLELAYQIDPT